MEYVGKQLSNETEILDGNLYKECRFEKCKMIYRGGEIPHIHQCEFDDCTWHFEEAAGRTIVYMRLLYHGMGEGGKQLIDGTIAQLREPLPPNPGMIPND